MALVAAGQRAGGRADRVRHARLPHRTARRAGAARRVVRFAGDGDGAGAPADRGTRAASEDDESRPVRPAPGHPERSASRRRHDRRRSVLTGDGRRRARTPLTDADLDALADVPTDGEVHLVDLPDAGEYRVAGRPEATDGRPSPGWSPVCRRSEITSTAGQPARPGGWRSPRPACSSRPGSGWRSYAGSCGRCARWPRPPTRWPSCRCPRARST